MGVRGQVPSSNDRFSDRPGNGSEDPAEITSARQTPRMTVAICTLNRPEDLRECLRSLSRQTPDPRIFEVLVVDNGPHRTTADVTREFSGSVNLRYVVESRRGLSHARRTAWREAAGDFVAYLDDDASACPGWADAILTAFDSFGSDIGSVGGPVEQVTDLREPLEYTSAPRPGGLNLGRAARIIGPGENIWGCNMAFPRAVLAELNAFGDELGHVGTRPGANEDIIIQKRLERSGYRRAYAPGMQILHNSWRSTATARELLRLAYWTGVDDALMVRYLDETSWRTRLASVRGRNRRLRPQAAALKHSLKSSQNPADRLAAQMALLTSLGYIRGQIRPLRLPKGSGQSE